MAHPLLDTNCSPYYYVPHNLQHRGGTHPPYHHLDQSHRAINRETYQLPPLYPQYGYQNPEVPLAAPAVQRRSAIACTFCRRRKIRCSGYKSSQSGRCENCQRLNKKCLFHPVSSQALFVPASVLYGPTAGGDDRAGENGQYPCSNGEQPSMLYGTYGQPLGLSSPFGPYELPHSPRGFPAHGQTYPEVYQTPPGQPYAQHGPGSSVRDRDELVGFKTYIPTDDSPSEKSFTYHSPHPNVRPGNSMYDLHIDNGKINIHPGSFDLTTLSPTIPSMSHPLHSPQTHAHDNNVQRCVGSPPADLVSHSTGSIYNPGIASMRDNDQTSLPGQVRSTNSPATGRTRMSVQDLLQKSR